MSRGAGRGNVTIDEVSNAIVLYESGDDIYVCKAPIGSPVASSVWQIMKINTTSGVVLTWCDGNNYYDNVATNLVTVAAHSYS